MLIKVQKTAKKGFAMAETHIISALVAKIARIQGEIDLHYKAIKGLEVKANTLKQSCLSLMMVLICVVLRRQGIEMLCLNRESLKGLL